MADNELRTATELDGSTGFELADGDLMAITKAASASGLFRVALSTLKAYFLAGGGAGLPVGGTAGQVLTKLSGTDGDADWADPTGGGGGGSGGGGGNETLISEVTTSGNQTSVDFTAIPDTFDDLIIRVLGRSSVAGQDFDRVYLTINSDTGNHYRWVYDGADVGGSFAAHSPSPAKDVRAAFGLLPGGTSYANGAGYVEGVITSYAATVWNKNGWSKFLSLGSGDANMYGGNLEWQWNDNAAISDLLIQVATGAHFEDGTVIGLFGRTNDGGSGGGTVVDETKKFLGSFDKWNAAKARGASAPARALFLGDSNVMGLGSITGGATAGAFLTSFARQFADARGWQTGSVFANQNVGNMGTYEAYNPTVSHTGGWGVASGGGDVVGGTFFTSASGAGGHVEWTPTEEFKNLRVYFPTNPGLNGAMTVTIDGSLVDTFTESTTAGVHFNDYAIGGSLTTHTVQIGCSGSGDGYLQALEINDGTDTPVYLQGGWSGAKAADLDKGSSAWSSKFEISAIAPDYCFIYCTINDANAQTAGDTYYNAIEDIVRRVAVTGDGCIFVGFPSDTGGTVSSYLNNLAVMLRQLAKDYDWSFYDYREDFGYSWKVANDRALAFDGNHPNVAGHVLAGAQLEAFVGPSM